MKKMGIITLLFVSFFLVGCEKQEKVISNGEKVNVSKMQHKHCTRTASADSGVEVSLNYDLYYTGEKLNLLHSEEKVTSTSNESLDLYQNAYESIHQHYEGLEYYDTSVVRGGDFIASAITINYDKIDIGKLLDIEGEEDNIIENGEAKVEKWLALAKKLGAKCEDVSDAS